MSANQNVLHAFVLKASQEFKQGIGGFVCHAQRSGGIELPRDREPAQHFEPFEFGKGRAHDAAWAGGRREPEHAIELPAAVPRLDRIEHDFRTILSADDSCHHGIIT